MKQAQRAELDMGIVALNQIPFNTHTRNRVHMVDFAFSCLLDSRPETMLERSYPTAAPLGRRRMLGKYIVFPVGATSDNKLFRASVMAPIIDWANANKYSPVIVGTKTSYVKVEGVNGPEPIVLRDEVDKLDRHSYVDMREKTSLLELRDLCGHAAAVVGVDGGTLHLAGTTDANIVYGLTTTLPKHRFIARNGDPSYKARYVGPRNLACAGCQSNWRGSRQDFRFCAYNDNLCTERLHADDFIEGLKQLLT
jgi:ADP-heptose:LPS heptosyltransferase